MQCAQLLTLLRLLLVLTDTTQSGWVDLLYHLLLLSNLNGSLKKNSRKMVPKLFIENAYEISRSNKRKYQNIK